MCGIAGFWSPSLSASVRREAVRAMTLRLAHRGPDADGHWVPADTPIALGHRRLAILDLSATGAQPMWSASGRYVISFNGEIYNFRALRERLHAAGASFRGTSDTEVLLAGFEAWGITETLREATGMFAIAVWDVREQELALARDRVGEKPLYWGVCEDSLVFASELKALRHHPDFKGEIDRGAVALLMRYGYVPAPYSIYRDIGKVRPGTVLRFRPRDGLTPTVAPYWSALDVVRAGVARPPVKTDAELIDELDTLLRRAVADQMVADVPLGAFLSGGIDSTTVVAMMQAQSRTPVRTFSIGFFDPKFEEARHARAVAAHLRTIHTEHYLSAEESMRVIDRLPSMYDEPFADWSQIPTYLVSTLARDSVTVALTGDGGDELFGGYDRYVGLDKIWNRLRLVPRPVRLALAKRIDMIDRLDARRWNPASWARDEAATARRAHRLVVKARKVARLLRCEWREDLYQELLSSWSDAGRLVPGADELPTAITDVANLMPAASFARQMMHLDLMFYLPDDVLVKVDRAAMAVSLETRAPFLDHRVVEFASQLPLRLKLRNKQSKWILRQLLDRYVPRQFVERPKMGFGVPLHDWLRGPLREWAEAKLDPVRIARHGVFDPIGVRHVWEEHLRGYSNNTSTLWPVLMFDGWASETLESSSADARPGVSVAEQLAHGREDVNG
ncbi:MAG TPA: asparagine synthase (glutamine-hydrolyzing) [Gemmatimonadaceae bacterium]|nr:asparagine synthase (glutamine-hydrolyzing) [Gemmatimonadaceae bacterium]